MNKIFIVALISLSLAFACHSSCNCAPNSNVCDSCKDPNSTVDQYVRSCPCNSGYYTASLSPFSCAQSISVDGNGNQIAAPMQACELAIGLVTKDLIVNTDCHFDNSSGQSFVVSAVSLNKASVSISDECFDEYKTKAQFQDPSNNNAWVDIPPNRVTSGPAPGQQTMQWPLMEIYTIAIESGSTAQQITNTVSLRIYIGHSRKFVRIHSWKLYVYTNRDQVNLFQIDVDLQKTEGCQPGEECIVVADLLTIGTVYTDGNYNVVQNPNHIYEVGQIWYARIVFADSSYTKKLLFQNLFYKNDANQVFNFNSITTATWDGTGLRVQLVLVEPSAQATIQINMLIDDARRQLRNLQDASSSAKQQFTTTIVNPNGNNESNADQKENNGMTIIFCLFNLFALLFMF